jgi:hypothetical protein
MNPEEVSELILGHEAFALPCDLRNSHAPCTNDADCIRAGDLQIGANFNLAQSDYLSHTFLGFEFYTTFDLKKNIGIGGKFHQSNDRDGTYERTYEIRPRYVLRLTRGPSFPTLSTRPPHALSPKRPTMVRQPL